MTENTLQNKKRIVYTKELNRVAFIKDIKRFFNLSTISTKQKKVSIGIEEIPYVNKYLKGTLSINICRFKNRTEYFYISKIEIVINKALYATEVDYDKDIAYLLSIINNVFIDYDHIIQNELLDGEYVRTISGINIDGTTKHITCYKIPDEYSNLDRFLYKHNYTESFCIEHLYIKLDCEKITEYNPKNRILSFGYSAPYYYVQVSKPNNNK